MEDCEFCDIVKGRRPAAVIHETEHVLAFLDQQPAVRGHTLVVPKTHRETVFDPEGHVVGPVFDAVHRITRAMRETLDPKGFSVFHTSGGLVGHIRHAHVHLLPRYEEDGVHISLHREDLDEYEGSRLASLLGDAIDEAGV